MGDLTSLRVPITGGTTTKRENAILVIPNPLRKVGVGCRGLLMLFSWGALRGPSPRTSLREAGITSTAKNTVRVYPSTNRELGRA